MQSDAASSPARVSRRELWVKGISLGVILLSLVILTRALPWEQWIAEFQDAVKTLGVWGPLLYGVFYAFAVVLLVPGSLLTLAAGAVFGVLQGTLIVSLASTTGAALAFLIARYFLRHKVQNRIRQSAKLTAVDQAIGQEGWKIVALLRLSPAVPFTLQNYLYGVTAIRFWPCLLTSWIAMLPGTFLYVYLGSLGRQALAGGETTAGEWIARGVGLLATVVVTVFITRLAKKAIRDNIPLADDAEATGANAFDDSSSSCWKRTWLWCLAAIVAVILAALAHWQKEVFRSAHQPLHDSGSPTVSPVAAAR
jgi:uncharacterized membrane protein YdjX (TVP38/TMEM64 family)